MGALLKTNISLHASVNEYNYGELEWHSVERMYLRQRPKSENWTSLTPRSSTTVRRTEKSTGTEKLPGPWTTTWSKQYISAVHPVTFSLLWVRCLFDRLRQILNFQIFRIGLKSRSVRPCPDTCRHAKFHPNPCTRLSNLANRQADRQRNIAGNRIYFLLCRR